jgi:hypothetical protein
MGSKLHPFLAAGLTQVSFTLDAVVAVALAIFLTGFVLGVVWRSADAAGRKLRLN